MNFLLTLHSINRWIIVVVAVIALVKFALGWLGKRDFQRVDQSLMTAYTALLDLQLLLGIVLLIWQGFDASYRIEHAITMVIAIVLAHLARRWRAAEDVIRYRNYFLLIAAGMLLIIAGVTVLPQGWFG